MSISIPGEATGARDAGEAQNTRPLRGEAYKAKYEEIDQMHGCKCTGAGTVVRAETQGPLRGEAHKAKEEEMGQMHGCKCTGAGTVVRAETQAALGERRIRQHKKKWTKCTGASARVQGQW